jgi:hypothetical protein
MSGIEVEIFSRSRRKAALGASAQAVILCEKAAAVGWTAPPRGG